MKATNALVQAVCNSTLQTWGGELYVGVMTVVNSVREILYLPVDLFYPFRQGIDIIGHILEIELVAGSKIGISL